MKSKKCEDMISKCETALNECSSKANCKKEMPCEYVKPTDMCNTTNMCNTTKPSSTCKYEEYDYSCNPPKKKSYGCNKPVYKNPCKMNTCNGDYEDKIDSCYSDNKYKMNPCYEMNDYNMNSCKKSTKHEDIVYIEDCDLCKGNLCSTYVCPMYDITPALL